MRWFKSGDPPDRAFAVGIILKGLDGVLEVVGGVLLLVVSPTTIDQVGRALTQHELSEDPHDFLATHLLHATGTLMVLPCASSGAPACDSRSVYRWRIALSARPGQRSREPRQHASECHRLIGIVPADLPIHGSATEVEERPDAIELARVEGAVAFERVTFGYPGTSRPALRDVSFEAAPGELVALVGPTGAGKTLIANVTRPRGNVTRPWGIGEAWTASVGAVLMLLTGVVSPASALVAVGSEWNLRLLRLGGEPCHRV